MDLTNATLTTETFEQLHAPLCHRTQPGDRVTTRRLTTDGGHALDVLAVLCAVGGADGLAWIYDRHNDLIHEGRYHASDIAGEPGAVELPQPHGEPSRVLGLMEALPEDLG
jgi:hypothetical protein